MLKRNCWESIFSGGCVCILQGCTKSRYNTVFFFLLPSLLYNGYWASWRFSSQDVALTTHPSLVAKVKERVGLCLHSPSGLSWPTEGELYQFVPFSAVLGYCCGLFNVYHVAVCLFYWMRQALRNNSIFWGWFLEYREL
jgi:hypothetical protein